MRVAVLSNVDWNVLSNFPTFVTGYGGQGVDDRCFVLFELTDACPPFGVRRLGFCSGLERIDVFFTPFLQRTFKSSVMRVCQQWCSFERSVVCTLKTWWTNLSLFFFEREGSCPPLGVKIGALFLWKRKTISHPLSSKDFAKNILKRVRLINCSILSEDRSVLSNFGGRISVSSFERGKGCPPLGVKFLSLFRFEAMKSISPPFFKKLL